MSEEGPSGSGPEEQTPHQTDEATFAKQLAEELYWMSHGHKLADLVPVADPQTLGQLRSNMPQTVHASIFLTLAKDLRYRLVAEIETALA